MAVNVAKLLVQIGANSKELDKVLAGAKRKLSSVGDSLIRSGRAFTTGLTLPLAAAGGAALKFSGDFDQAMARSTAIMGELSDAMRTDLATAARQAARDSTYSATQTAEAFYFLASAGLNAEQSLDALPRVVKFATAGNFDLATATDLATDAQSALGLKAEKSKQNLENLTRVTDVLVKANTLANASVEQFSKALTNQAGAALRQVGKDIEEGVAVLAVYADQGIKAEEAGTKLFQVLRDLQKAANSNGAAFKDLGIEVFDSRGEMRNLADIVQDFETRMAGASDQTRRQELSLLGLQEKSIGALLSLIGFSDEIRRYEGELRKAGGTTDEVANRQIKNLRDQFTILLGRAQDIAIEIGQALTPTFVKLFEKIESGLEYVRELAIEFSRLPPSIRETTVLVGGLLAALGPATLAIGLFTKGVAAAIGVAKTLAFLLRGIPGIATVIVASMTAMVLSSRDFEKQTKKSTKALEEQEEATTLSSLSMEQLKKGQAEAERQVESLSETIRRQKDRLAEMQAASPNLVSDEMQEQLKLIIKNEETWRKLTEAVEGATDSAEFYRTEIARLSRDVETNSEKLKVYNEQLKNVGLFGGIKKGSEEFDLLKESIDKVTNKIEEDTAKIASYNDALMGTRKEIEKREAFVRYAEAVNAATASFRENNDQARLNQENLKALQDLHKTLEPILGKESDVVSSLTERIEALDEKMKSVVGTTQHQDEVTRIATAAIADWRSELDVAAKLASILGTEEGLLADQVSITESAIREATKALAEKGLTADEIRDKLSGMLQVFDAFREKAAEQGSAFAQWRQQMERSGELAALLGTEQSLLSEKISITEAAIRDATQAIAEHGPAAGVTREELAQMLTTLDELRLKVEEQNSVWFQWGEQMRALFEDAGARAKVFSEIGFQAMQGFADGVGQSFARAAFFSENFGKSFGNAMKNVAAQAAASFISMTVQMAAFAAFHRAFGKNVLASTVSSASGRTYAGTFASVMEALPFPINIVAAPVIAAGQVATMLGGIVGFDKGGMTLGEGLAYLHPREVITPFDRLEDTFGGRETVIKLSLNLDGEILAEKMVRLTPGVLNRTLGNGGTIG